MQSGLSKSIVGRSDVMVKASESEEFLPTDAKKERKDHFWRALSIYIQKPHVINRKICGIQTEKILRTSYPIDLKTIAHPINIILNSNINNRSKIDQIVSTFSHFTEIENHSQEFIEKILHSNLPELYIIVRKVIPKSIEGGLFFEVILLDKKEDIVIFVPQLSKSKIKPLPQLSHSFSLTNQEMFSLTLLDGDETSPCCKWLKESLTPRLNKWSGQVDIVNGSLNESLRLVDILEYNKIYQELKGKYAQTLINMWTESTDPLKFVHEDIGIAAYLLLLWKEERINKSLKKKQTFLDMGCGNGLLVYILTMMGHVGLGLDIKSRRIWESYPSDVILKEEPIEPSCEKLYPEFDWLIGNHSDELTPWIPVIATKSSWTSNFFLLPCCPYDFYSKFRRIKSGISQYNEYLEYVEQVIDICGFEVEQDKLRIPSTKRICFIGRKRTYNNSAHDAHLKKIDEFIHKRKLSCGTCFGNPDLIEFKVREKTQEVRNCTNIKPEVKLELVNKVSALLLKQINIICFESVSSWNKGGQMALKEVASSFTASQLQHLKRGCGGLQTFLKNHRNIFRVTNGFVQIRVPEPVSQLNVPLESLRTKPCWFFKSHPNSCPLKETECAYSHSR